MENTTEVVTSKEIYIRRRKETGFIKDEEDNYWYIGSALNSGGSTLRGIDLEDEKRFLKNIVGVSPTSPDWEKATKAYWDNIRAFVPAGAGLKLEIGWKWENDEDRRNKRDGTPINIDNWLLYQYCLQYKSKVAPSIDLVNKSAKIKFYIFSKEEAVKTEAGILKLKNTASRRYLEVLSNRALVDNILKLYSHFETLDVDEKDIILYNESISDPKKFLEFANNSNIEVRAFIENCINAKHLLRMPNTDTVAYNGKVLGYSSEGAVEFLRSEAGAAVYNNLKILMGVEKQAITVPSLMNLATGGEAGNGKATNVSNSEELEIKDIPVKTKEEIDNIGKGKEEVKTSPIGNAKTTLYSKPALVDKVEQ